MRIGIVKGHGSGNDFPMVDGRIVTMTDDYWAGVAVALADRAGPVGGDGLLVLTPGDGVHDFGMRMWNPDGSESETCLNGLRCIAQVGDGEPRLPDRQCEAEDVEREGGAGR